MAPNDQLVLFNVLQSPFLGWLHGIPPALACLALVTCGRFESGLKRLSLFAVAGSAAVFGVFFVQQSWTTYESLRRDFRENTTEIVEGIVWSDFQRHPKKLFIGDTSFGLETWPNGDAFRWPKRIPNVMGACVRAHYSGEGNWRRIAWLAIENSGCASDATATTVTVIDASPNED